MISENRPKRLNQNGTEPGYNGFIHIIEYGQMVLGLEMASKAFKIIYNAELGKPIALPNKRVGTPQGGTKVQGVEDLEKSKSQFVIN